MAEVQLALQRGPAGFEKLVVIKLVHENLAAQKDFVDMLLDEARVAALVKHPNVVDIYDLGEAGGRFFIAMEYLEGEPLLAVLRAGREGKRLDPLSTARLVADTAEGLDAAHELRSMGGEALELVHHDVSLGNIVVLYNGQVKLVDFGVAKATQTVSQSRRVQGKFSYMAPEKLRGGAGDRRSDIWSLGCVLWEALTLKRLFKGGNDSDTMRQVLDSAIPIPSQVNGDVLADFDPIVMRSLQRDPEERYPTAKAMAADLEEVLRKQQYGGKNDKIAKYMQATFDAHISARKKLLQEVSSKGGASSEVLEAAFDDQVVASGSPVSSGEFSVRFRRGTAEMTAEGTPRRSAAMSSVPVVDYPRATADDLPRTLSPPPEDSPTMLDQPVAQPGLVPAIGRRRLILAIAGLVAAAVAIVVAVLVMRGDDEPTGGDQPRSADFLADAADPADAAVAPPIDAPEVDASEPSATGSGSGDDAGSDFIDMPPDRAGSAAKKARPADAAALTKSGIQAYLRGDPRGALALFKRSLQLNQGYAPTWRGIGAAYEKLGDRGSAKAAYQRYLNLVPNAADAAGIRTKLENL
jgi:eukaryotic-like serine/threonine-protein kinase